MDDESGRNGGNAQGAFGMGNLRRAYRHNMLRAWAGDEAEMKEMSVQYRAIDEDHYGAALAYRFGGRDDPDVAKVMEHYQARTARDADVHFVFGDAEAIIRRIARYVENDACKFILRPVADGDEDMYTQTRRLVEEVLPLMAQRWPRRAKSRRLNGRAE